MENISTITNIVHSALPHNLTEDEYTTVTNALEGKHPISKLSKAQLKAFNHLLSVDIRNIKARAVNKVMKIQQEHVDLLAGKTDAMLCMYDKRKKYFGDEPMHANLDHIVPVQIAYGKDCIRMVSICEGVPIWTSGAGMLTIRSDNLYEARSNKHTISSNGECINIPRDGKCICRLHDNDKMKTEMFEIVHHSSGYDWCDNCGDCKQTCCFHCRNKLSCVGVECTGVLQPLSLVADNYTKDMLSTDPFTYMSHMHSIPTCSNCSYCSTHMPYYKHTATQEKAVSVMNILRKYCMPAKPKKLVIGYVNIQK